MGVRSGLRKQGASCMYRLVVGLRNARVELGGGGVDWRDVVGCSHSRWWGVVGGDF